MDAWKGRDTWKGREPSPEGESLAVPDQRMQLRRIWGPGSIGFHPPALKTRWISTQNAERRGRAGHPGRPLGFMEPGMRRTPAGRDLLSWEDGRCRPGRDIAPAVGGGVERVYGNCLWWCPGTGRNLLQCASPCWVVRLAASAEAANAIHMEETVTWSREI